MTLPADDADFSGRWRRIKSWFTREVARSGKAISRDRRGEYVLWQRRFWEHTVRDETDFARHVDYVHFNPVKHGLVSRVRDWPHSSFHRYVRSGILPRIGAAIRGAASRSISASLDEICEAVPGLRRCAPPSGLRTGSPAFAGSYSSSNGSPA
jgi:putative transposase